MQRQMSHDDTDGWFGTPDVDAFAVLAGSDPLTGAWDPDSTIVDRLRVTARMNPDRIACRDGARVVRFDALCRAVDRLASHISLAADRSGPVGILLPFGMSYLAAVFACVAAGRPCVLLDAGYPSERTVEIIRSTGVVVMVVDDQPGGSTQAAPHIPRVTANRAFDPSSPAGPTPMSPLDVDAPAFILCTSGSTGRPRAFVLNQRGVLHRAWSHVSATVAGTDDCVACLSSPASVAGLFTLTAFPVAGVAVQIVDVARDGFRPLLATLQSGRVTILRAGPAILRMLVQLPGAAGALAGLRNVTTFGENLRRSDVALLRTVLPNACRVLVVYGSTEAPGTSWFAAADDDRDPIRVPAGRLVPGVEAMIVDDLGAPVPTGRVGELLIRSRYVSLGEWQDGRCVPGCLLPDPTDPTRRIHRTGDLARRTADGVLVIMGRKGRMVQINGQRVEPAEIEAALMRHPAVEQAAVVARDGQGTVSLHAFVVLREAATTIETDSLRVALREALPGFMVPSTLTALAALPLLPSGKVDVKVLMARH
jgi:acyl-coenzyme A synthetase/AMP-(fatty) acid ligase